MRRLVTPLLLLFIAAASGCSTVAKTGFYQIRGSGGHLQAIDNLQGGFILDRFDTVLVQDFTDPLNMASSTTMTLLPGEVASELRKTEYFPNVRVVSGEAAPTESALLVSGEVVSVIQGGTFSAVIGQKPLLVADVRLIDSATGEVLGRAHCTGIVLKIGDKEQMFGEGIGKAVADWVKRHRTKPRDDS